MQNRFPELETYFLQIVSSINLGDIVMRDFVTDFHMSNEFIIVVLGLKYFEILSCS